MKAKASIEIAKQSKSIFSKFLEVSVRSRDGAWGYVGGHVMVHEVM